MNLALADSNSIDLFPTGPSADLEYLLRSIELEVFEGSMLIILESKVEFCFLFIDRKNRERQ